MSVPRPSAPSTRLLHVSDLHFGGRGAPGVERGLQALIERKAPELVVASGDLTHRGTPDEHAAAANFLRSLGPPVLAIPGNHDIPYTFPARFTHTFAEFERHWETTEPVFRSPLLHVVGLNSVRPWRHQSGGIREAQLERARKLMAEAAGGAVRIVALHHHLIGAPWRSKKKPVSRRSHVLAALVDSGAELILAGHIHQVAVSERHEFEVIRGDVRGVVVSIAPGLGQPRPNRRGEARGLHVYEFDAKTIRVETHVWREDNWGLTAVRRFARGREALAVEVPTERLPVPGSP
jgi:3',5'-cyclic AMP phosphodiesterase CpdA